MSDDWREELIEKMAKAAWESDGAGCRWEIVVQESVRNEWLREARAALAVAEPVIREQADNILREEIARLREQNTELMLRAHALLWLLPPEITCGELQKARDEMLAATIRRGDKR